MSSYFNSDIKKLNSLYSRISFSFIFLYGRYGTGKTSLLRDFCRGKLTCFYSAQETVPQQQLFQFHQEVVRVLQPQKCPPVFTDWNQAFTYIAERSASRRLILILDEIQLLAQHSSDFMISFTEAVRHNFPAGKVFLIATSSSPSFAQEMMQDSLQEPFDAVTARASLGSIPFYSCQPDLAHWPSLDQILLYGATGGLPSHMKHLNRNHSAEENILHLFFRNDSPLLSGPLPEMHRELREISTYNYLLGIMASDITRLADISSEASIGTNKCAKYLNTLISLGLIRKEFPACGDRNKKVRYTFSDHMLRFWYRFVYPNISGILFGNGQAIYESQVKPYLNDYLLPVFETVCAEYLEKLTATAQTPFVCRQIGSWWTGGTKREPYFRIPIVAADDDHAVLGWCHCGSDPAAHTCLNDMLSLDEPFEMLTRYCLIFSTSGFTDELKREASKQKNVWLIEAEEIAPHEILKGGFNTK